MNDAELNAITEKIIGCAFTVSNTLGCGFLEIVYQNALVHELRKAGLRADPGQRVSVVYDGLVVGDFVPDILIEGAVIVELKAVKEHNDVYTAQCLNYLKATGLTLCLLLNFGAPRVDVKRYRR